VRQRARFFNPEYSPAIGVAEEASLGPFGGTVHRPPEKRSTVNPENQGD
jgi:hypothetical protein